MLAFCKNYVYHQKTLFHSYVIKIITKYLQNRLKLPTFFLFACAHLLEPLEYSSRLAIKKLNEAAVPKNR